MHDLSKYFAHSIFVLFILIALISPFALGVQAIHQNKESNAIGPQNTQGMVSVGMGAWFHNWDSMTVPDASFERDCDRAAQLSATIIRTSFRWDMVEPTKGNFRWDVMDYIVNTIVARAKPQAIIILLTNTAGWAAPSGAGADSWRTPPSDIQGYKDYLTAIVSRYKGTVEYWEIWNEPNQQQYWLGTVQDYAELLQASYQAIKASDPSANVLGGVVSNMDYPFVTALYNAGAKPYFDILSVHPYCNPYDPTNTGAGSGQPDTYFYPTNSKIFDVMAQNGDQGKPVWFTELAWADGWSEWGGVTPDEQAEYMTVSYNMAKASWPQVRAYVWFASNDSSDGNWGLYNADGSKRPSWNAFTQLAGNAVLTVTTASVPPSTPSTSSTTGAASSTISQTIYSTTLQSSTTQTSSTSSSTTVNAPSSTTQTSSTSNSSTSTASQTGYSTTTQLTSSISTGPGSSTQTSITTPGGVPPRSTNTTTSSNSTSTSPAVGVTTAGGVLPPSNSTSSDQTILNSSSTQSTSISSSKISQTPSSSTVALTVQTNSTAPSTIVSASSTASSASNSTAASANAYSIAATALLCLASSAALLMPNFRGLPTNHSTLLRRDANEHR